MLRGLRFRWPAEHFCACAVEIADRKAEDGIFFFKYCNASALRTFTFGYIIMNTTAEISL